MAGIELRNVSKAFPGSRKALESLDLEVREGELLVLVGPSGSGKTSLLRLIAGLDLPTTGSIFLAGRDLRGVPPQRRDVALVFQQPGLYGHLSVRRNIAFGLELRSGGWIGIVRNWLPLRSRAQSNEQVAAAARLVGIEPLLARRADELSGGERQRVAVGRAIARQPKVWLMDEPLASLDAPARLAMRREIKDLQRKLGTTTIYVTHDQAEALALADRIAVLDQGRLQHLGTPREIYDHPRNVFVAKFFGSQGMNLLPGTLVEKLGEVWFQHAMGAFPLPAAVRLQAGDSSTRQVIAGLRPEALELGENASPKGGHAFEAMVQSREDLGELRLVQLSVGPDNGWIARSHQPLQVTTGEKVTVRFRPEQIHWFSAITGQNLVPAPEA